MVSGRGLLLTLAIVIAGFTVVSIRSQLAQPQDAAVKEEVVRVLVAKRDLAVGTFIQGVQDLEFADPPALAVPPAPPEEEEKKDDKKAKPEEVPVVVREPYFMENTVKLDDFNGAVVRRPLKMGEPVPQSALMKSGEGGFLSAVLEAGMRAVSIAVNATTGNAGFVSPGDRVDLIVTHRFKNNTGGDDAVVSETFVEDVRVVAVDQMLDNPDNKAILAKTVTVECTRHQAEQIAVASEMGKISLALRSVAKGEKKADKPKDVVLLDENGKQVDNLFGSGERKVTTSADIGNALERRVLDVPRVQVIRGDKTETLDFTRKQP